MFLERFVFGKRKFYFEKEGLLVFIDFQKSYFSNSYYLNYYFVIKELHETLTSLSYKIADFGSRLGYYTDDNKVTDDFELDIVLEERIVSSIHKEIEDEIMPAFEDGIVKYLNDRPIIKKMSSLATKDYLDRILTNQNECIDEA